MTTNDHHFVDDQRVTSVETTQIYRGSTLEQELEILWRQGLHGSIIRVDGRIDHRGLLLLKLNDSTLDGVFNAKTGNGTRTGLSNAVAAICGLPLSGRVPPTRHVSINISFQDRLRTYGSTMKTREASVRFRATPPAFKETRKHSTSILFIKWSMDAAR